MKEKLKSLILIPSALPSPEFEILLSRAQDLIDKGRKLDIVSCNGSRNNACHINPFSDKGICKICRFYTREGIKRLSGSYNYIEIDNSNNFKFINKKILENYKFLRKFKYKKTDFGLSVFSSYIAVTRDLYLDGVLAKKSITNLINTSKSFLDNIIGLNDKNKYKDVCVYNGRMSLTRPTVRYFKNKTKVNVLEYSGARAISRSKGVFEFKNHLPTDMKNLRKLMLNSWKKRKIKEQIYTRQFFIKKKAGELIHDKAVYVKNQDQNLLPFNWDKNQNNIVIFTSSEDEYNTLGGDYEKTIYPNQSDGLVKICNTFATLLNKNIKLKNSYKIWVRIHPNVKNIPWNYSRDNLSKLKKNKFIELIDADSKVSTYKLLDYCSKSVCFASIVGVEANYWGKPSIILSRRVYDKFKSSFYVPRNHNEVIKLIMKNNLKIKAKTGSLIYSNFWSNASKRINYFEGKNNLFYFKNNLSKDNLFINLFLNLLKFKQKNFDNYLINFLLSKFKKK